jgi:uncharacterized protein
MSTNIIAVTDSAILRQQVNGYLATHSLCKADGLAGLRQIEFNFMKNEIRIDKPQRRLGKRAEQFFIELIKEMEEYDIVCQNVQLKSRGITIGEIDCIIRNKDSFYHIEHVYKFYLYDETSGERELDRWVGPNRKDCLNLKLDKLRAKQLPNLHTDQGVQVLQNLNISIKQVQQRVYFKAQLFIQKNKPIQFKVINSDAVTGYYYRLNELPTDSLYFIPTKINWLLEVQKDVEWKTFEQGISEITTLLGSGKSQMCWIKSSAGVLEKCFVIWW